ncbi:MAG TPA: hypothetical protein VIL69_19110 [Roseomonas sp.]
MLSETTVQLGEIVTTRGSGDRLMPLMGSETRDEGEPPPTAEQLDAAVELYRETSGKAAAASADKRLIHSACQDCARANGGVWPAGHVATWSGGCCDACGQETAVRGVNDWTWPTGLPCGWIDSGWG